VRTPAPGLDREPAHSSWEVSPEKVLKANFPTAEMAGRTRPIVRLDRVNRMVTKGYQKGVYERVTNGICGLKTGLTRHHPYERG